MSDNAIEESHPDQFIADTAQIIMQLNGRACTVDDMRSIVPGEHLEKLSEQDLREITKQLNVKLADAGMITVKSNEP